MFLLSSKGEFARIVLNICMSVYTHSTASYSSQPCETDLVDTYGWRGSRYHIFGRVASLFDGMSARFLLFKIGRKCFS